MIELEFRGEHGEFAYQTMYSAGADLVAQKDVILYPGDRGVLVPTGVYIVGFGGLHLTNGQTLESALMIYPRSGLSKKSGLRLSNSVGVVDPDYPGEIMVMFDHIGGHYGDVSSTEIKAGERIAQLVATVTFRCKGAGVRAVERTAGFGSTNT